jgi:protein SCO1
MISPSFSMFSVVATRSARAVLALALALAAASFVGGRACADAPLLAHELPAELEGVGIVEHLNQKVPLDLRFKDETGKDVRLGDYFTPGKPVLLTINYLRCDMLCTLTLNGLVDGLNQLEEFSAGKEFRIVTVSMSPAEGPELAKLKKTAYLTQYKRETAKDGWHFLTGDQQNIDALCKAVGFGYRYDPQSQDYAHTSTIMFLTPDGRLSRYINNVVFEPRDLKLALVESSEGNIGSAMDKFLLYMCYHYDPLSNSYAASAMKIVRLSGVLTVLAMGVGFCLLWRRGGGGRRLALASDATAELNDVAATHPVH